MERVGGKTKGPIRRRRYTRARRVQSPDRLLLKALHARWNAFLIQFRRCTTQFSEPAVHDLRVAVRRVIAAIDLLRTVSSSTHLINARRTLKHLLKTLGPLRDIQIQKLAIRTPICEFPELEPLATILLLREQRSLKQIPHRLDKVRPRSLQTVITASVRSLERSTRKPGVRLALGLALQGSLAAAFARLVELRQEIDPANLATIHRMRVAFKKFRYATEILSPDTENNLHKAMNAYQTGMGEIHDLELLMANITSFAVRRLMQTKSDHPTRILSQAMSPRLDNLGKVQQSLRRQQTALVRKFIRSADELHSFYNPGQPFDKVSGRQKECS